MKHEEEDPFARSQSDVMAGLAGIFFVLMAGSIALLDDQKARVERERVEAEQRQQEAQQRFEKLNARDDALRDKVRSHLRSILNDLGGADAGAGDSSDAGVADDDNMIEVRIDPNGEYTTFDPGKYELRDCEQKRGAAKKLVTVLRTLCSNVSKGGQRLIDRIVLEGHTDNQPSSASDSPLESCGALARQDDYRSRFGANVELSSRRAVHLLRVALESSEADDALRACVEERFLVSGRGPLDPLCAGKPCRSGWRETQTRDDQTKTRRVVFRVYGRTDYSRMGAESTTDARP